MANETNWLERIAIALERIANVIDKSGTSKSQENTTQNSSKKEKRYTDIWVLQPYNMCITTYPPKYLTSIYHYHDPKGISVWAAHRGPNSKIFYSKKDSIEYCKSLGSEYEIIDIPAPQTISFGNDYE